MNERLTGREPDFIHKKELAVLTHYKGGAVIRDEDYNTLRRHALTGCVGFYLSDNRAEAYLSRRGKRYVKKFNEPENPVFFKVVAKGLELAVSLRLLKVKE